MAWAAVDEDESEWVFEEEPDRGSSSQLGLWVKQYWENECVELPKGSIEKLIGRKLTWEDEPVELKEENEQ